MIFLQWYVHQLLTSSISLSVVATINSNELLKNSLVQLGIGFTPI